ncbi:LysR substrate-binding domain-containing protein [Roseibium aggregatum]|uniref:LysR family transcriptional regulator n=1 Tax=Roseibium aggregatum TaxID=187304 RepID=A0A939J6Q1_9HYPH|nr:LysR substrate-binding domain-containing protein [Roseibium aggregatum]MBN9673019.1 LysR family transcriptional regulator [Roseibium aggregatum]
MLKPNRISLNSIRVFLEVADGGSVKLAAAMLGVTPGAVSHQIRSLETAMGVQLLNRSNNSVCLTDIGAEFASRLRPGLQGIEHAIQAAVSGVDDVSVLVPITLATRWLIPRLEHFHNKHPDLHIRIETTAQSGTPGDTGTDIAIAYHPAGTGPSDAEILFEDRCRPYLSPDLLSKIADPTDLAQIPALQSARGNWDWRLWLESNGKASTRLNYAGQFDLDDAALRGAISGLGMVLAPYFIIEDDLTSGRLLALPATKDIVLGAYTLHCPRPVSRQSDSFLSWLRENRAKTSAKLSS